MSCEDQALVPTKVCFKCLPEFDALSNPVYPPLERRGRYWCCSKCGGSYGENPHPDLPAMTPTMPGEME